MKTTSQVIQQPAGQSAPSTGSMLTQISSVLAVVILLILACAWVARRFGFAPKKGSPGQGLTISASCQLGQRERVVIVDIPEARLVLGVTAHQITLLHTLPPLPEQENPQPPATTTDFRQVLQQLIKRPGKR